MIINPWRNLAFVTALLLIAYGLAWEILLDPLRPGGSWLALKVLPLLAAVPGLYQGRPYTFKWMSLAVWLYVGEALVRVASLAPREQLMASISLMLSLVLSVAILMGARAYLKSNR